MSPLKRQKTFLWTVCGVVAVVLTFALYNLFLATETHSTTYSAKPTENVLTGASRLNPQESWNEKMTQTFDVQEKEIKELKAELSELKKMLSLSQENAPKTIEKKDIQNLNQTEKTTQKTTSPNFMLDLSAIQELKSATQNSMTPTINPQQEPIQPFQQKMASKERFRSKGISKTVIALQNARKNQHLESVDNTLPAGSFAQGVILSGIVADTSQSAASNPQPVLIELADSGDLSRYFTSSVKGCRVIGSGYGSLAKERVMVRLEQMTCIEEKTGEIINVQVDGYVSGEDGENGLRGVVVDRAGEQLRSAFATGFLSSFSNFLAASSNPVTFATNSGLATINPLSGSELLKQGLAKGSSGALDKFTEFYIKRAESLDPVILVNPGRVIDVVFTKSVSIGKSLYRQKLSQKNDKERNDVANSQQHLAHVQN